MFEQWADTLTGTLDALEIEQLLQLIFFHPDWTFRDGGDRYVIILRLKFYSHFRLSSAVNGLTQ